MGSLPPSKPPTGPAPPRRSVCAGWVAAPFYGRPPLQGEQLMRFLRTRKWLTPLSARAPRRTRRLAADARTPGSGAGSPGRPLPAQRRHLPDAERAGPPAGRRADHLDRHGPRRLARPRSTSSASVPRRPLPDGARLQPQRPASPGPPCEEGNLPHPGRCQGRLRRLGTGIRRRDRSGGLAGDRRPAGHHARRPTRWWPCTASAARPGGDGACRVRRGGRNPSWQSTNELPSEPARSTNFFVAGMLPNTTYEMRDVFSDGTTSAPCSSRRGASPPTCRSPPSPCSSRPAPAATSIKA